MRLLKLTEANEVSLTDDLDDEIPPYTILSHTWGPDKEEVTFTDVQHGHGQSKTGQTKLRFCGQQAKRDQIDHFWVDTCCIDKTNLVELSEAVTSMFRWYENAEKCYVYLADVPARTCTNDGSAWEAIFRSSRWFRRGWTLQELLAPKVVQFFSQEWTLLGDKMALAQQIHKATTIPIDALCGTSIRRFPVEERFRWAKDRHTKKKEDKAYCLLGIFDVSMPLIYGEGDKAITRLRKEIRDQSSGLVPFIHTHWIVPRSANPLFTGRVSLLQELEDIVRDAANCLSDRDVCKIVIAGVGGQGKSEICLQLARRLRSMFWAVLWIDVSTRRTAETSFVEAAKRLSIPAQDWEDARHGIANLEKPWLLILDNADDTDEDYQDYFIDGKVGVVIMTTRNDECRQYGTDKVIDLEGLDANEASQLLLKAARVPLKQHEILAHSVLEVANLLQFHPLALIQAGTYISRGHCTFAEYPGVYERLRRRLLVFRPTQARSRYGDVFATFEVSVEMLKAADNRQTARDALELLSLLAVCEPNQLPLALFETAWKNSRNISAESDDMIENGSVQNLTPWHVERLPSFLDVNADSWDSFRLTEALGLLKGFSMVSTDSDDTFSFISIHGLVHAWARDRQDDSEQHAAWLKMGCLMALTLDQGSFPLEIERPLQPHIEALTDWQMAKIFATEPCALVARILVKCGSFMHVRRADTKLLELLQRLFTHLDKDSATVEQQWIGLYGLTARNLINCGKLQEGMTLLKMLMNIRKQTLPKDHEVLLALQHELALAYLDNRQPKEAVALLEEVVNTEQEKFKEYDLKQLLSQLALGRAYQVNNQDQEAVALLEKVVIAQEQALSDNHPHLLASQRELAGAYRNNGDAKKGLSLIERVVEVGKQVFVEDHIERLAAQHSLAVHLVELQEFQRAHDVLASVVEVRGRVLAKNHPSRLQGEEHLATIEELIAEQKMT